LGDDARGQDSIVYKDTVNNSPSFTIETNNSDTSFTITKDTGGVGRAQ